MRSDNDLLKAARDREPSGFELFLIAASIGALGTLIALSALGNPI